MKFNTSRVEFVLPVARHKSQKVSVPTFVPIVPATVILASFKPSITSPIPTSRKSDPCKTSGAQESHLRLLAVAHSR